MFRRTAAAFLAVALIPACDRATERPGELQERAASKVLVPPPTGYAPSATALAASSPRIPDVRPEIDLSARSGREARAQLASRQVQTIPTSQPTAPGMIIRNGDVSIQVDSVDQAIAAVRQLAATLGGYVGNVSMLTGTYEVRSASLELKVPAPRFDDALAGLRPLGKVERSTATAEDVGEEFVDISARVANARRLETRLVELLARRTGKLDDVLSVERELARVREEIERYEGRIRYLSARVATSTIVVTVHEKAPLVATNPGTSVLGQAFKGMWRNFVRVIAAGIESLGVLIPLAGLVWVLHLAVAWWRRKVRAVTSGPATA